MGQTDDSKLNRKGRKTANQEQSKRRVRNDSEQQADWTSANFDLIAGCIGRITKQGGAIRFGYTSDGGAYAVGIYGDGGAPYTDYVRPHEDIDAYLLALYESWA